MEHNPYTPPDKSPATGQNRPSLLRVGPMIRADERARDIAITQRFRASQRAETSGQPEHLASIETLRQYLKTAGHEDACKDVYSCNPWKYEPVLYADLGDLLSRDADETDPEKKASLAAEINHLRGLIRAGSWMAYKRPDVEKDWPRFSAALKRHQDDLDPRIENLEMQIADQKLQLSDPKWIEELETELARVERFKIAFKQLKQDIQDGIVGEELEDGVRALESIYGPIILRLVQSGISHGMNDIDDVSRNAALAHARTEIEDLRPIRDVLYFRRLYPTLASNGVS